jgi:hypothetical protein
MLGKGTESAVLNESLMLGSSGQVFVFFGLGPFWVNAHCANAPLSTDSNGQYLAQLLGHAFFDLEAQLSERTTTDISEHRAGPRAAAKQRDGQLLAYPAGKTANGKRARDADDAFVAAINRAVHPFDHAVLLELPHLAVR